MRKINNVIQDNFLHERLNQFDQLTQLICNFMSLPLENRVWPIIRGRRLILMTDDPQLATQARFMQKPLCKHINDQTQIKINHKISGLDIKLMSMPLTRKGKHLGRNKISEQTSEILGSIAESIDDQELQTVLQRLAKQKETVKKPQTPPNT